MPAVGMICSNLIAKQDSSCAQVFHTGVKQMLVQAVTVVKHRRNCMMEFLTKRGTLGQLGLLTPNPLLLLFLIAFATGTSVFAFGRTIARAQTGNMSPTYGRPVSLAFIMHAEQVSWFRQQ